MDAVEATITLKMETRTIAGEGSFHAWFTDFEVLEDWLDELKSAGFQVIDIQRSDSTGKADHG